MACTLTAGQLQDRRSTWQAISPSIVARRRTDDGFEIAYLDTAEVRRSLPALAAAEAECCAFAGWRVDALDGRMVLAVTGAPDGVDVLAAEFGLD